MISQNLLSLVAIIWEKVGRNRDPRLTDLVPGTLHFVAQTPSSDVIETWSLPCASKHFSASGANSNCLQRSDRGQRAFYFFDAFRRQGLLRRQRSANRIPLKNQSALDAGGKIVLGERLVQVPQSSL